MSEQNRARRHLASAVLPQILDIHLEEAAFLWELRQQAALAPHYSLDELARLDGRLEANL